MLDREAMKFDAKQNLSNNYIGPFLVCLLISFLVGEFQQESNQVESSISLVSAFLKVYIPFDLLYLGLIIAIFALLVNIFVINPLIVGNARYFLKHAQGEVSFTELFTVFKDAHYLKIVIVMLWMDIKIGLWTLCLIIPGIYKGIQYSMIPYLLADNSEYEISDYFEVSKAMTSNEIGSILILCLSFLGWYFLGAFIIIGFIFVNPYYEATYVQLYQRLLVKLE